MDSARSMEEWGQPNTVDRLKRIAEQIASQIRKASARAYSADSAEAIDDWRRDLARLEATSYHGHFRFRRSSWPPSHAHREATSCGLTVLASPAANRLARSRSRPSGWCLWMPPTSPSGPQES